MSYKASLACAGAFAAAASLAGSAFAAEPAPSPPRQFRSLLGTASMLAARSATPGAATPSPGRGISNDDELAAGTFSQTPQGVIGGAHVGYNLQYNQWLVFGIEGSVDGTSLSHTLAVPVNDVVGDTPGSITATALRAMSKARSAAASASPSTAP